MPLLTEITRVCPGCMIGQGRHCKCRAPAKAARPAHNANGLGAPDALVSRNATAHPMRLSVMLTKVLAWAAPTA